MAELRLSAPVQFDSIVDGEGLRAVIWTQGCPHGCPGCHNPQTHPFDGGTSVASEILLKQLKAHFYLDGVTFSGGEPMAQAAACGELAQAVHQLGMNVWCYTGYTWEALMEAKDPDQRAFLEQIDVLIDGPFVLAQKSQKFGFRGWAQKRRVVVQATLKSQCVVLAEKN